MNLSFESMEMPPSTSITIAEFTSKLTSLRSGLLCWLANSTALFDSPVLDMLLFAQALLLYCLVFIPAAGVKFNLIFEQLSLGVCHREVCHRPSSQITNLTQQHTLQTCRA